MRQDREKRPVPVTRLRDHYNSLKKMSTHERLLECDELCADVTSLVTEFCEAVTTMEKDYDNRDERFYPETGRTEVPRKRGAVEVVERLGRDQVCVSGSPAPYEFQILHHEVNPLRTTRAGVVRGTRARWSGAGGLDYVALLKSKPRTPILGEIKYGSDKDAYYAFVQLLTYLSELSSKTQFARAKRFLFNRSRLVAPFDLHILLADYNAKGKDKRKIIESTGRLAEAFKTGLRAAGAGHLLGRVLCLKMSSPFNGTLQRIWSVGLNGEPHTTPATSP